MAAFRRYYELLLEKEESEKFCDKQHRFCFDVELMCFLNNITQDVICNAVSMGAERV